jgi:hypothetical protein
MVAGFLVLGLAAGLVAGATALIAGQAFCVVALAYMLGAGLGLVWAWSGAASGRGSRAGVIWCSSAVGRTSYDGRV